MDEHTHGLKRQLSDEQLRKYTVADLYALAEQCAVEPADESVCDACAAYLIAQEQKDNLHHHDITANPELGWSDTIEQIRPLEDWMARAMTAEAALAELWVSPVVTRREDGTLTMQWPEGQLSTLVSREVLQSLLDQHNDLTADVGHHKLQISHLLVQLAQLRDSERPCVFMPGDRVMVMLGNSLEGGTVEQIRIPGPMRPEKTVYIALDLVDAGGLSKNFWFNPDQVERLGG